MPVRGDLPYPACHNGRDKGLPAMRRHLNRANDVWGELLEDMVCMVGENLVGGVTSDKVEDGKSTTGMGV